MDREYQDFIRIHLKKFKMKNSVEPKDDEKEEKVDSNGSAGDSLPIHYIIQAVSSLEDVRTSNCQHYDDNRKSSDKNWWECDCKNVEMSGCVVVPEDTCIRDFVKTVLVKLGYPSASSSFASGSILIRNWKPLPLKSICPGMNKSVGDILRELTAIVSLRIQIFRPQTSKLENMKNNLLNFLAKTNQTFLTDSGCPFDTETILNVCGSPDYDLKKQFLHYPSEEIHEKFNAWLKHQESNREFNSVKSQIQPISLVSNNSVRNGQNGYGNNNEFAGSFHQELKLARTENGRKSSKCAIQEESINMNMEESSSFNAADRLKHAAVPKTRIRTSFDPELELPKLHKWYSENPHPSRQQIYEYVSELNSLESRKGRKQLDVNNVLYWFKNARAAQKRTECRNVSNVNGNRGSVLKIPLGKGSAMPESDDQRSVSGDETFLSTEPGEDYRKRNDRCLQVVGKWNSNGQGEAVLEMQIASRKNEFNIRSQVTTKKEPANENDETSIGSMLRTDEDSLDPFPRVSSAEKKDPIPEMTESKKEVEEIEPNKTEISDYEGMVSVNGNEEDKQERRSPPKIQLKNSFSLYKEDSNCGNDSAFVAPYKSGFPVSSHIFEHSLMCMSQYMSPKAANLPLSSDEKRKRNRTFIDPVTEVPRLEQWFQLGTHPSHNLIARYTEELNSMPYRRKFSKLETKNVQFWFKNRRAKNKRLNYLEVNK